jgi:hypothetical protein
MTLALCLFCGEAKFGAWCPCHKCHAGPSGDKDLDIAFSDHLLAPATIEGFGEVVKTIRQETDDRDLVFWTFIRYISQHHPQILTADVPPELAPQAEALLARLQLPEVKYEPGRQLRKLLKTAMRHLMHDWPTKREYVYQIRRRVGDLFARARETP